MHLPHVEAGIIEAQITGNVGHANKHDPPYLQLHSNENAQ